MGRAGGSRGLGLGKLVLWIGLLLMVAVVGCSSEEEPAPAAASDATSSGDQMDPPDSGEAQKAACEAKNSGCTIAYWSNTKLCVIEISLGASCGSGPDECRGNCGEDGQCIGPGPDTPCGKGAPECNRCDGKGACSPALAGAACKVLNPQKCRTSQGVCGAFGICVAAVDVGGPCTSQSPSCGVGTCDSSAQCVPAKVGAPCPIVNPSNCVDSTGVCNSSGQCKPVLKAVGSPCPIAEPSKCAENTGTCGSDGSCKPVFKAVGAPCTTGAISECSETAGVCAADGSCAQVPKAKGTPCGLPYGKDCSDVCNGAGQCVPNAGADCTKKGGVCGGLPGVCDAEGYCAASLPCGKNYFPQPCGEFAMGKSCKKTYKYAVNASYCDTPSGYPTANSNSCGDAGDPCQPKLCSVDLYSSATCTAGQMPDGAPCPGVAANPCSAATCLSGRCQTALKPAGTPCTPLAPKQCGAHACNAAGECAAVVPAVPLAGSCTLTDGDTDCWVKSCDGAGTCTKVPRPAGEACGVVPDDACSAHRCDGKGWCVAQLTSETALCKHSDCLLPTATYNSPCPVGPCVDSGCMKLGLCYTKYKPAGTSCKIDTMAGTCDSDHHCNLTGKGSESVVGKLCIGQFPCMKEDVAYGEDGACHGTVATGEICGTPCKPGICGVDGTCQTSPAPKGTACRNTQLCGNFECDGKGECAMPEVAVGKSCGASYLEKLPECQHYACYTNGLCGPTATVGKACVSWDPCMVGTCGTSGTCEFKPISGPVCSLAKPDSCNSGVCKVGKCEPVPKPGGACGKETACMAYQCDAKGQCAGVPKPGASCESTGTCTKGVCDLAGQCTQVLDPGAKCMGKEQCMEGVCSPSGACLLGPKPAGSQCVAVAPGTNWDCYTGICDGKGGCTLKINTGAKCKEGDGACTAGECQSDATCKAIPANLGKACQNQCATNPVCGPTGKCEGTPLIGKVCDDECLSNATCSAQGECVGTANVGQACGNNYGAPACQSYACNTAGKCSKTNSPPGDSCVVGAVFPGEIPSYPCGSLFGTCNGSGGCVPTSTDPDGTPCGADDGCANTHVCKGGLCLPVEPKANGTPCKFGCANGTCGAGACLASMIFGESAGAPCNDGDPCTSDYCVGSPLPGMSSYLQVNYGLEYVVAKAGTCTTVANSATCPGGKPPKPMPKCLLEGCPVNECGAAMICQNPFNEDQDWYCKNPPNTWGWPPPACYVDNPCVKVGCTNDGNCSYQPLDYPKQCGAFKFCKGTACVALE